MTQGNGLAEPQSKRPGRLVTPRCFQLSDQLSLAVLGAPCHGSPRFAWTGKPRIHAIRAVIPATSSLPRQPASRNRDACGNPPHGNPTLSPTRAAFRQRNPASPAMRGATPHATDVEPSTRDAPSHGTKREQRSELDVPQPTLVEHLARPASLQAIETASDRPRTTGSTGFSSQSTPRFSGVNPPAPLNRGPRFSRTNAPPPGITAPSLLAPPSLGWLN